MASPDGCNSNCASPFDAALHNCNYTGITANDAMFAKNIGRAEEELMALMIYTKLSSEGLDVSSLDLNTAVGHGRILAKYATSDYGFSSLEKVLEDLRSQMVLLVRACEDLVNDDINEADYKIDAHIATRVFLKFSFGFYLFNGYSIRYSKSFSAVLAALRDNKLKFKAAIDAMDQTSS